MTLARPTENEVCPSPSCQLHDYRSHQHVVEELNSRLRQIEADECELSYNTECRSERGRKKTGSYYTPVDVAEYFWDQFFFAFGLRTAAQVLDFLQSHTLIEPSAGSGVLIFSFLKKLIHLGVPPEKFAGINLYVVDINLSALRYIEDQTNKLNEKLGGNYLCPTFEHVDFLKYTPKMEGRSFVFFGNPPFVANTRGSRWKNIYADFIDRCVSIYPNIAAVHFIVPLSIAFSRDYIDLRDLLRRSCFSVFASHFDNIPDALFKSGKPQNENTNKANSQRCTIISAIASEQHQLFSTKLHRWRASERSRLLSNLPQYLNVTNYRLDGQFIRPASPWIARYLQCNDFAYRLGDLVEKTGKNPIHIGSVARNFIPVRDMPGGEVNSFSFSKKDDFYRFFGLLTSDVFFEYWLSIGDGFHLTRSNVMAFPVSETLEEITTASMRKIKMLWKNRSRYQKSKLNSGSLVRSYDFSRDSLALARYIDNGQDWQS